MATNDAIAAKMESKRLDPIGKLFSDAWKLFNEKGARVFEILLVPVILILIGQLCTRSGSLGLSFLGSVAYIVGYVFFIAASAGIILIYGRDIHVSDAYRQGFKFFWALVWIYIIAICVIAGGFVMLIIPGIIVGIWFAFTGYTLVLENHRGMGSLTQSREYARGFWWAIFGRGLLAWLVSVVGLIILSIISALIFGITFGPGIASAAFTLIFSPFLSAYAYVIYRNFTEIKPELQTSPAPKKSTFFVVSAIIGIVGAIVLFVFIGWAIMNSPGNMKMMNQYQPNANGTTGTMPVQNSY